MARIFLSYAHEDLARARSLARALERSGHEVWWDSQVRGGAQFGSEINRALDKADAIVVLWSSASIESAWVQDEAAEGRDSGRLIPISVDGARPPLGFRQYQAIDLSRGGGKPGPGQMKAIEGAIAGVARRETDEPVTASRRRRFPLLADRRSTALAIVLAVLLAAAGLYWFVAKGSRASASVPTLAVLPFADLSPARDKAYFAEGVAEEIRTLLSNEPRLRITGRTSTEILGHDVRFDEARRRLGISHLLEGSVRVDGERLRLSVRLISAADGTQIWAEGFDRQLSDVFAIQDEVGLEVASRLRGSLIADAPALSPSRRTSNRVFDLYLAAVSKMNAGTYRDTLESRELLRRALELDPRYAPAWARLAWAELNIEQERPSGQGQRAPEDVDRWRNYLRRALALDPRLPEAQAWLARFDAERDPDPIRGAERHVEGARRAIALDQSNFYGWHELARAYSRLCRPDLALQAWSRAAAIEPLLESTAFNRISTLAAYGRFDEAEGVLRQFTARAPNASVELAQMIALERGDLSLAIQLGLEGLRKDPEDPVLSLMTASALQALGYPDRAVAMIPADQRLTVGAYWNGRYSEAAAYSARLKTIEWSQERAAAIARSLVRLGRNAELSSILLRRHRSVDRFLHSTPCNSFNAGPYVAALRGSGRTAEAGRLLVLAEQRLATAARFGPVAPGRAAVQAELLVLHGRGGAALGALERAARQGWIQQGSPVGDIGDPNFDPIRNHPRFAAVERAIADRRAKERRELAAAGLRI